MKTDELKPEARGDSGTAVADRTLQGVDGGLYRDLMGFAGRPKFRGGAVDNLESTPMGKGHGNEGRPFDLNTACYLKPVFAEYDAARRMGRRLFLVLLAGVKTIKSFTQEVCMAEHVCNGRGDVAIFFGSAESAETTATTRILDFCKGIPRFATKMETLRSRFDDTMGAVKFPDKTLFILSANLGNTQQKNLAFVGLQDAFVTGTTGMIKEMMARTTQYQRECIIFLESQGGEKGFDFDREYENTDQRELHVKCPACDSAHIFNWKAFDEGQMTRGDDFQAVLTKEKLRSLGVEESGDRRSTAANQGSVVTDGVQSGATAIDKDLAALGRAAAMELTELLKKPERRVAGFKRGDRLGSLKLEGGGEISDKGEINEAEVLRNTCFECFHCGSLWRDDGEFGATRIGLDQSSHYVSVRKDALPGSVGFNIPQWINRRLSWGVIMLEKLRAHRTANEFANFNDLKKWWQKTAARTWDPELAFKRELSLSPGSYDPEALIPDEFSRDMAVDCQQDQDHMERTGKSVTGWFWYIVRVYDRSGNAKQLARGFAKSWEEWIAVQRRWKVPNDRVVIDIDQWPTQIMQRAAEEREIIRIEKPVPPFYLRERVVTWYLLAAENSPSQLYKGHRDGNPRPWSPEQPLPVATYDAGGKRRFVQLKKVRFAKRTMQLQLDAIRSGAPGLPRLEVLDRKFLDAKTSEIEKGNLTYQKQMDAQYYSPDLKKYVEARPDDHYSWCEQALLVRKAMDGLFGHVTVFDGGQAGSGEGN